MLNKNYKKVLLSAMILMGSNFTKDNPTTEKEQTLLKNNEVELAAVNTNTQKNGPAKAAKPKDPFFGVKVNNQIWLDNKKYSRIVYANYYMSNNLISEQVDGSKSDNKDCTMVKDKLFYLKNKQVATITKLDDSMSAQDILQLLNKAVEIALTDEIQFSMMKGPNCMTTNQYVLEGDLESLLNNPWTTNLFILDKDNETLKVNQESLKKLPEEFLRNTSVNPSSIHYALNNLEGCKIKEEKVLKYFNDCNQRQMEYLRAFQDKNIDLNSLVSNDPEQNKKNLADGKKFFKETSEKATKYYGEDAVETHMAQGQLQILGNQQSGEGAGTKQEVDNKSSDKNDKKPTAGEMLIGFAIVFLMPTFTYQLGKSNGRKEAAQATMNAAAAAAK